MHKSNRTYAVGQTHDADWPYEVHHCDGGPVARCRTPHHAALVARALDYLVVIEEHFYNNKNPLCSTDLLEQERH